MSASAADEDHRHVVDIGARAAGDDQPSAGRQGMVDVVIPKDSKQIRSPPGKPENGRCFDGFGPPPPKSSPPPGPHSPSCR